MPQAAHPARSSPSSRRARPAAPQSAAGEPGGRRAGRCCGPRQCPDTGWGLPQAPRLPPRSPAAGPGCAALPPAAARSAPPSSPAPVGHSPRLRSAGPARPARPPPGTPRRPAATAAWPGALSPPLRGLERQSGSASRRSGPNRPTCRAPSPARPAARSSKPPLSSSSAAASTPVTPPAGSVVSAPPSGCVLASWPTLAPRSPSASAPWREWAADGDAGPDSVPARVAVACRGRPPEASCRGWGGMGSAATNALARAVEGCRGVKAG